MAKATSQAPQGALWISPSFWMISSASMALFFALGYGFSWFSFNDSFPLAYFKSSAGKFCTIIPLGGGMDDTEAIVNGIKSCGEGSTITLPSPYVYTISQVLETDLTNRRLEIFGTLQFSDNITYWRESCLPVDFQNQCSAWSITGSNFELNGGRSGGLHGNGQVWMSFSAGESNTPGRPISVWINNASGGLFQNFKVIQPQFWGFLISNSKDIAMKNVKVLGVNTDPNAYKSKGSNGSKWVQNLDGANTYRSNNISFDGFEYLGGDDLIALKGNSTNIAIKNVLGYGGNGIAIGSIGQYPGRFDLVENVTIEDVKLYPSKDTPISSALYFKSWVGIPEGIPPNGGGGGSGLVKNITAKNFFMSNITVPIYVESCLTYLEHSDYSACNTSTLKYQDLWFENFSGTTNGFHTDTHGITGGDQSNSEIIKLSCSSAGPCTNITFKDFSISPPSSIGKATAVCHNVINLVGLEC